ncbi:MAG: hypothetical protein H6816_15555 [Phycisphaerales bacterium]|nr:hypothetical protein [Phycisphaerales bacterium]
MTKLAITIVSIAVSVPAALGQGPDALDDALASVGLRRADLGRQFNAWWPGMPGDIPYKLRGFDSLMAQPLDAITYARILGATARTRMDPTTVDADTGRGTTNLYHAVHALGVNPKFGALRGFATNLRADETPLVEAILRLHEAAGRTIRPFTFQTELPYPDFRADIERQCAVVPEAARPILGRLVTAIVAAHRWADLAFRNVDFADRAVVARRYDVGFEQVDGYDYCPAFDDVARALDEASLWYAGEKCVQALDDARIALQDAHCLADAPDFAFDWETPWGWIRVRGGGADAVDGTDALLIVDFGGDDTYTGGVAASTAERPIGLLLDCGGNDHYRSREPAQGAGLCGIGVLIDAAGDDEYRAERYAQGVGQFGLGVCADLGGADSYALKFSGQGCGYFGIGLMLDFAGDDAYSIFGDGEGLGGVAGVGVLADRAGDDTYTAVRSAKVTGRPSYHSPGEDVSVSNVQGCAIGRRGDGGDGHAWAGGLGALIDVAGNDRYTSGNWSMGAGYWFGAGLLYDGAGDDEYHGVSYCEGAGAHFCLGVLLDEGGDDKHLAEETSNRCIGYGHDFAAALHVDIGGNDAYVVRQNGISYSVHRGLTLVADIGGNDTYASDSANRPGHTEFPNGLPMGAAGFPPVDIAMGQTRSVALFLDIGGDDRYWGEVKNDSQWRTEVDSADWKVNNRAVGVDRERGAVHFTSALTDLAR